MNQSELIEKIIEKITAKNMNLSKNEITELFSFTINILKEAMENGHRIELRGLGSFAPKMRTKRVARNPKNNQNIDLDERLSMYFRAGKPLLEAVNS